MRVPLGRHCDGLAKLCLFGENRFVVRFRVVVVGFRFPFPFLRSQRFLPEGSSRAFKPLFTHSSHVVGGSFAVLLAASLPSKDQFRKTQEVVPGSGVVLGSDS